MRKITLLLALLLCFSACFAACGNNNVNELPVMTTSGAKPMDLSTITPSEYVVLGEYKGLTIEYLPAVEEKSEMVWEKLFFTSTVLKYPEQQIEYYLDQIRAQYIYVAKERGEAYEDVLNMLGITDETMLKEAQIKTKTDLISRAIIQAEGIVLTEEDKAQHVDKYISQFVNAYGYTEDYVRANLMNAVYDVMLEEKMLEKLVLLNTFVAIGVDIEGEGGEGEGEHEHEH